MHARKICANSVLKLPLDWREPLAPIEVPKPELSISQRTKQC